MAFDLNLQDPLIANNFDLEIQGAKVSSLTSVEGLELELEKMEINQRTALGHQIQHTALSKPKLTGELTVKRLAPLVSTSDEVWVWFNALRDAGMSTLARKTQRKNGSIVIFDTTMKEIARWNFFDAWPSKIASDGVEVGKNEPISETITFQYEKLERLK